MILEISDILLFLSKNNLSLISIIAPIKHKIIAIFIETKKLTTLIINEHLSNKLLLVSFLNFIFVNIMFFHQSYWQYL